MRLGFGVVPFEAVGMLRTSRVTEAMHHSISFSGGDRIIASDKWEAKY